MAVINIFVGGNFYDYQIDHEKCHNIAPCENYTLYYNNMVHTVMYVAVGFRVTTSTLHVE